MLQIEILHPDGNIQHLQAPDECVIGKGGQNEVHLDSWRVSKEHARLFSTPSGVLVEDMGAFTGVTVNGQSVDGQYGPLKSSDEIGIGPFKLKVSVLGMDGMVQAAHPNSRSDTAAVRNQMATEAIKASRLAAERVQRVAASHSVASGGFALVVAADPTRLQLEFEWRKRIHAELLRTMDLRRHDVHGMSDEQLRRETSDLVQQIMVMLEGDIPHELDRTLLSKQVLDEAIGLGPGERNHGQPL
jgi:pilus assembly protein CpaF